MKATLSKRDKRKIRDALCRWFADNQRHLPWRKEYHPYQVWIAEIMGQQTQMERVVTYFNRWMHRFPTIDSVARASEQEILKAWEGLGYYSRARNIHRAAQLILARHNGQVPDSYNELLDLPGIGPYTAAAIASIAYNRDIPLVDANVERVLARLTDCDLVVKTAEARQWFAQLASDLLPPGHAGAFNQALMEFGALVCRPGTPRCPACILADLCRANQASTVGQRPVRKANPGKIEIIMACCIIEHKGQFYIQQRRPDDVWGGLWEFPGGRLKSGETPGQAARREVHEETGFMLLRLHPLATVVHHYTKYRVTLHGFLSTLQNTHNVPILHAASQFAWVSLSALADFPFPAGHRKLRTILVEKEEKKFNKNR